MKTLQFTWCCKYRCC